MQARASCATLRESSRMHARISSATSTRRQLTACGVRPAAARVAATTALTAGRPAVSAHGRRALIAETTGRARTAAGAAASGSAAGDDLPTPSTSGSAAETATLKETRALVETAMLAAVSGLAYVVSTLLKLDTSLGYILPLPPTLAAMRSGARGGWRTMMATAFLLVVLLGPVRAINYVTSHGMLAAVLGTLWVWRTNWWLSVTIGAVVRMACQLLYILISSFIMNENLFALVLSNAHSMLDQITAATGGSGAPSTTAVVSMIFGILLVNGFCYVFLLHVIYRLLLVGMGFQLAPAPGIVNKLLFAGMPQTADELAAAARQRQQQQQQQQR